MTTGVARLAAVGPGATGLAAAASGFALFGAQGLCTSRGVGAPEKPVGQGHWTAPVEVL